MRLELIEVDQADQLSACRLSLLLGVFTPRNQLEGFLKFARSILKSESAILAFHHEPYVWHSSPMGFKAFHANPDASLLAFFNGEASIGVSHENYDAFSKHVQNLGVEHSRIIAIDLKTEEGISLGQVVLFDSEKEPFVEENLNLVHEFSMSLIRLIELRSEYADLKELYEQQSALNFSKTKFFQIIAHDLRAPFHGLLGFSEVLAQERDTLDETSIQSIADYLNDTAHSTYNLLESLLNWAMSEGGRFVYHPINFDLKHVIQIVHSVLNSLAIKKKIQLIDQVPNGLLIHADMNMTTSVIQNLVSNALKFTHVDGTGKVLIDAKKTEQGVKVSIRDTGLGMSQAQIDKLFQPDLTVSIKGTSGEKGAGLGLVLCKRFVDLNKGHIHVTSKEGVGTTFEVTLPCATNNHQNLNTFEVIEQFDSKHRESSN